MRNKDVGEYISRIKRARNQTGSFTLGEDLLFISFYMAFRYPPSNLMIQIYVRNFDIIENNYLTAA